MKIFIAALVATTALTGVAFAEDKPVIGPAPAWVKPVASLPLAIKADDAPVRILLSDQQIALEPGRQTVYSETSVKIQTPQGLAAGNISLPWRPGIDVLTVHKLLIRRGEQTIDVLKSGQTFTVLRREQNLENATLDGVLTANIQPEGLQVGDTLEFAASVSSSDPTLKGHVEQITGGWNDVPIGRLHLRMQWPASLPVRFRQSGSLPPLKPTKKGDTSTVEFSLDDMKPIVPPKNAPPRYRLGRLVEATDFASWTDLGALMAPLYAKAAAIPAQGTLRSELEKIRNLSTDPKIRTEAALALVQDRVRYVALMMGAGGYVPADAETTWSRRYGDCKGKTALLLALLRAMDITAEPVAVSTTFGDGMDARLPMVGLFDHVLVRASVAGRTYWLDGTRTGDTSLDRLTIPDFGWGLPLVASNAALVRMVPAPPTVPTLDTSIRIDASAGIDAPAPTKVETILRGDAAIGVSATLANLVGEARDRALRNYWKNQYDFIDVKTANATFDPKTGEQHLTMEGIAKMDWSGGSYQTDGTGVGYRTDFSRDPGPGQDAPFAVPYPSFSRTTETIILPKGHGEFKFGTGLEIDQTVAGIRYRRHATIKDDVFTIEKTELGVAPEFPAKDAGAAKAALRTLADHPATLSKPLDYKASAPELAAIRTGTPSNAYEYGQRASIFINQGMRKEALADYGKAIELDPANVWAMSNRAITRIEEGDLAGARADLDKAESIDPTYAQIFVARGMLADADHRPQDAVDAYTKVLKLEPGNESALTRRSVAYYALGNKEKSAADMLAAVEAKVAADHDNASSYISRAYTLLEAGRFDDAMKDFDKAVSLEPRNATLLMDRGVARASKDLDAASKDLDAAFAIDPKNVEVIRARASIAEQKGDWRDAVAGYTSVLTLQPSDPAALDSRTRAEQALGDDEAALRDATAAIKQTPSSTWNYFLRANILRKQGKQAEALAEATAVTKANPKDDAAYITAANIYTYLHKDSEAMQAYEKAIALKPQVFTYIERSALRPKTDVAGRRADIDAALKLEPNSTVAIAAKAGLQMDSGDLSGAIATYSAALAKSSDDPSLYAGRAVAYAKSGDTAHADADFERAKDKFPKALMCAIKTTAGVELKSALADCDAALAKEPDLPVNLDNRGLVLLRLGRLDDAIANYTKALAKDPNLSSSLFGRSIAWARKGDRAKSESDAAAAERIEPRIREAFERYGITL